MMNLLSDDYTKAVECFEIKDYSGAEDILLSILVQNTNDSDVLNFLGIIQMNLGDFRKAINYFNQLLYLNCRHPTANYNLGYCFEKAGNTSRAIEHYIKAIETDSDITDSYLNLANLYCKKEEYLNAEKLFTAAIEKKPSHPEFYNNLANLFFKLNKWDKAVENYKRAIELDPGDCDFHFNIGSCYAKKGLNEQAIHHFEKALCLKNDHKGAINNLANLYAKLNNFDKAVGLYQKLISIDADNARANFNLAHCYQQRKDYPVAIEHYKHAVKIDPALKSSFINIGRIHLDNGDTKKAEQFFVKAIEDEQNRVIAFTNLGVISLEELKIEEALSFFDVAISSNADIVEAHYNKAHALLLKGDYSQGWTEYEWRKKRKDFVKPNLSKPELVNQSIVNKKILVYAEQGLGDTIQFVRYLQLLKQKKCYIIFECDEKLAGLFSRLEYIDEVIICNNLDEPQLEYDYQIALLSLPYYFNTEFDTIPVVNRYITSDTGLDRQWRNAITNNGKMKVGIVWAGNPQNNRDSIRSLSLNEFVPLFALAEVEFYSIQLGQAAAQLSGSSYPVIDLGKRIKSFMDTTSIIKNMDLVISVDTSVIHLAGALGKPVWNLITYLPDWRWLLNRNDTRWYPSMKLYRQQKKGDWGSVINEVKYDLEKLSRDYRLNIVHKKAVETFEQVKENLPPLYLGLSHGENFGWGVCSKYLHMELTKRIRTIDLEDPENDASNQILPGYLFNVITNSNLIGLYKYSGIKNFGYTFFEYELTKTAAENAKQFDLVFAGSSWCEQKLKDTEVINSDILIQGIDPELFYPGEQKKNDNLFVIFSGGKFELRKGQDLVLKAIKILQEKYRDIILVNAWYNLWLEVIDSMRYSGYINFINKGNTWNEKMEAIYKLNKIDSSKIITLGLVPNNKMRELYLKTDIGLFPNRCEGGTNLVMMEYMACGKPVVASYNSGHKDILNDYNSIPLKNQKEFKIYDSQNNLAADWCEPQIDEIIEKIEFAYHNREYIKQTGSNAASHLKRFTWSHTASNLIKKIYN